MGYYFDIVQQPKVAKTTATKPTSGSNSSIPTTTKTTSVASQSVSVTDESKSLTNSSIPAASNSIEPSLAAGSTKVFPYEFRQTLEAIAMLVQVARIIPDSVRVDFSTKGVDISFRALTSSPEQSSSLGDEVTAYGMGFSLQGEIAVGECRFDVADKNMVVVLIKSTTGFWLESSGSGVAEHSGHQLEASSSVVRPRELSTGGSSTGTTAEATRENSKTSVPQEDKPVDMCGELDAKVGLDKKSSIVMKDMLFASVSDALFELD